MAGLAAAHELVERGFEVTVYERKALGGKARSIPVRRHRRAAAGATLPGEHGFRFFPGFYHHVPDSMRRIPFAGNANGVWDNLVDANGGKWLRAGDRADGALVRARPRPAAGARRVDGLRRNLIDDARRSSGVPPHELAYFVERLMVFLTSCDERRFGQWEHVSWWDFVKAESKSEEYQKVLAARPDAQPRRRQGDGRQHAHDRQHGRGVRLNIMQPRQRRRASTACSTLPTNEAWIDPWVAHLRSARRALPRRARRSRRSTSSSGRIVAARARDRRGRRRRDRGRLVRLRDAGRARAQAAGPARCSRSTRRSSGCDELFVDWMAGIQFYLQAARSTSPTAT